MSSVFTASSPGRLDVMGGIADYSGSLVLQMPIRNQTTVSIKLRADFTCAVKSEMAGSNQEVSIDYRPLLKTSPASAHQILTQDPKHSWAAYVIGCAYLLQQHKGIDFTGADFLITSDVPLGKGVSSSAALEVATMKALAEAFQISFHGTELPRLAQQVENKIVGAPCGLMDQLSSYFGKPDHLLPITCQPDLLSELIAIPDDLHFIGIDSGVRHSVSGSSYTDVRCAAFMGYSIIAQHLGVSVEELKHARESGDWQSLPFHGYLCNISTDEFDHSFKQLLSEKMSGGDFINQFHVTTDSVTQIIPAKSYSVLNCTTHPVFENARVNNFLQTIDIIHREKGSFNRILLQQLGELMKQAHHSYSLCGLGSDRTDEIVALARQYADQGIYGAKITGGGSGGTVCLLAVGKDGIASAKKIHREMELKYSCKLSYFG
jgi:L-arabinokinase